MSAIQETVLSIVSTCPDRRVVVALRSCAERPIVFRTESFSSDVGWFAQQSMHLTRGELQGLKEVLGVQLHRACSVAIKALESSEVGSDSPHLLSFEAARARRA